MKHIRHFLMILLAVCLLVPAVGVRAQDNSQIPQVDIEKAADGYKVPAELPEGIVRLALKNSSEMNFTAIFARLNEGVTLEQFTEALMNGPEAAVAMVTLVGGLNVANGQSAEAYLALKPGTYVLLDMAADPRVSSFTVADAAGDGAAAPKHDVAVSLVDFAFALNTKIQAGPKLWHIANKGGQWHEMGIFKIDEKMSVADYLKAVEQLAMGEDPSKVAATPVAFVPPVSQGEQMWLTIDLQPGTYVVICSLPDLAGSAHAHYEIGMVQLITVTA